LALQVVGDRLSRARESLQAVPPGTLPDLEHLRTEAARQIDLLTAARETLRAVVLRPGREDIAWLAVGEGDVRLQRAPLEVADHLEAVLYAGRYSVLATSATLTAGGSFDYSTRHLGLSDPTTLEVASPFDYRRAALVVLVDDLPEPGMPGYDAGIQ